MRGENNNLIESHATKTFISVFRFSLKMLMNTIISVQIQKYFDLLDECKTVILVVEIMQIKGFFVFK